MMLIMEWEQGRGWAVQPKTSKKANASKGESKTKRTYEQETKQMGEQGRGTGMCGASGVQASGRKGSGEERT
jgi:hypothetical protein